MLLSFLKRSMCIAKFLKIFRDLLVHERSSPGKFQHFLGGYNLMDLLLFESFFLNSGGCVLYIVASYTPDFTAYIYIYTRNALSLTQAPMIYHSILFTHTIRPNGPCQGKFGLTPLPSLRVEAHKVSLYWTPIAFKLGHANLLTCIIVYIQHPMNSP